MLACPRCRRHLEESDRGALCACGDRYERLPSGGLDFLQGREFADFHLDSADAEQADVLQQETAGIAWRMEMFIIPLIRRALGPRALDILDCGCGNGLSIDILNAHGLRAVGVDAGRARHLQWRGRRFARCLHSADALSLPFRDETFDFVLSSGLIEHIGIHEEEANGYRARRLRDCAAQRERFVSELVRVLKRDGFILIDHPNGSFPADFWHGSPPGSIRWHLPAGDMLPRFGEIRRYFKSADRTLRLYSISPRHRLRFQKVGSHWYGRAFSPAMKIWLRAMDIPGLRFLARSPLNPYLMTLVTRNPSAVGWIRP